MKTFVILAAVSVCAGSAQAAVFNNLAAFSAQLQPGAYTENFNSVGSGLSNALLFGPVNGFAFTVDSTPTPNNLFNDPGLISTNLAAEAIRVTFTGAPVTAVGGNFWSTDINVFPVGSTVTVTLSNGDVEAFSSTSASDFRGFTSLIPITSITIDAGNTATGGPAWPTMDNLIVGQAIPAPGAMAIFGLAGVAAARRRR